MFVWKKKKDDDFHFELCILNERTKGSMIVNVWCVLGAESSAKRRKAGSEGESDSDGEGTQRKRGATEADAVKQPVDLIVLGVNYKTTDEAFKEYFNTFGTVVFAEVKQLIHTH